MDNNIIEKVLTLCEERKQIENVISIMDSKDSNCVLGVRYSSKRAMYRMDEDTHFDYLVYSQIIVDRFYNSLENRLAEIRRELESL